MKLCQKLLSSQFRLWAGKAEVEAVKMNILEDRTGAVQRVVLGHHADASTRHRRSRYHVDPRDPYSAGGGKSARRADADRCRLAGAVWSEQAKEFALANAEIDAIYGDDALLAVIDFLQAFDLYDH